MVRITFEMSPGGTVAHIDVHNVPLEFVKKAAENAEREANADVQAAFGPGFTGKVLSVEEITHAGDSTVH